MDQKVGPLRNGIGLAEAMDWFAKRAYLAHNEAKTVMEIEVRNMLTVGELIAKAASGRRESRGADIFAWIILRWNLVGVNIFRLNANVDFVH